MSWNAPARLLAASLSLAWAECRAQAPVNPERPASAEAAVLKALANDPVTAPYSFRAGRKDGRVVLAGRVGTKRVHDVAVRLATGVTSSIDDRLVIDTAEVYRSAQALGAGRGPMFGSGNSYPPLYYPPPLFSRVDEPFYGFEPPVISYPPWWGMVAARRGDPYGAPVLDPDSPIGPDPGPAPTASGAPAPAVPAAGGSAAKGDAVEMTIDPRGVAVLRGTVPSDDIRLAIGQKAARMSGVSEVVNLLGVRDPGEAPVVAPAPNRKEPPPPPVPAEVEGAAVPAIASDDVTIGRRLAANLARRAGQEAASIKSSVRDGVAYLSGSVPSAMEAMAAFRAAQQTIGVREVYDRLEFAVPDGQKENPLVAKARPEDVEPYLEAQIRRQVGDRAHVDRVRVAGDRLTIRGTVVRDSDKPGVEAILRSMPLLRGFAIDATFVAE